MDKIKISNHQLWALMAMNTCGTSLLVVGANLSGYAKQDAWISAILTTVIGLLFIWMYVAICSSYPDKTFIEIIQTTLGKWIGTAVIIGIILLCLISTTQLLSYVNDFMIIQFLPETPAYAINIVFIAALATAFLYGLESIARAAEIFMVIVSVIIIALILLVARYANFDYMFPVLEKGAGPVFKGVLYLSSFVTWPLFLMGMMFFKNTSNTKATKKAIFSGYLWGAFLIIIIVDMSTLVLGSKIAASAQYPTYLLAQEINIENVLSGVEGIIAGTWFISIFFRMIIYFYGAVAGIVKIAGLKDYRKIILPLCLIVLVFSGVVYPSSGYEATWDKTAWPPFIFTFAVFVPVVLLVIIKIKRRLGKS